MRLLWHLVKFNFIFNRMRIAIFSVVCFFIVLIGHFFNVDPKEAGESILSYSSSLIFFVIVGKMSLRNNAMFDIKHLLGFPLSKSQIVFQKSIADLVHFFPVSFVWIYGLSLSFPEYHLGLMFIVFHILLVMLNMIALNKRIDFARIQHASASFKNSFLFLNKYLNLYIQIGFLVFVFSLIMAISPNILWREYAFFIFACVLLIFAYFSTLRILKDESLSYFIAKRDIKRMGWKAMVVSVPMVMLFVFHKNVEYSEMAKKDSSEFESFARKLQQYTMKMEKKADLLKLANASASDLESYIQKNKDLPWNAEVMGGKLPHMLAGKGNIDGLSKVIDLNPDAVNSVGTIKKRTPLFTALNSCKINAVNFLLDHGAKLDHRDVDGNTPILFAAKSGCYGGVLLLKEKGADITVVNNDKEDLTQLVSQAGLAQYWEWSTERSLASKKEKSN